MLSKMETFYKSAVKMHRLRSKKLIWLAISFPAVVEASVVVVFIVGAVVACRYEECINAKKS